MSGQDQASAMSLSGSSQISWTSSCSLLVPLLLESRPALIASGRGVGGLIEQHQHY